MSQENRTTLKGYFNTNDVPTESQFANLVDSFPLVSEQTAAIAASEAATATALTSKADLSGGKVPAGQLPSYVDDVLEYATVSALPATGETGKIYVITSGGDSGKQYRWTGSVYVQLFSGEVTLANLLLLLDATGNVSFATVSGKLKFFLDWNARFDNVDDIPEDDNYAASQKFVNNNFIKTADIDNDDMAVPSASKVPSTQSVVDYITGLGVGSSGVTKQPYADEAEAIADTDLPPGGLYGIVGSSVVHFKPLPTPPPAGFPDIAGVVSHWDAETGVTADEDDIVSVWTNRITGTATSVSGKEPSYVVGQNGKHAVQAFASRMDLDTEFLRSGDITIILAAANETDSSGDQSIITYGNSGNSYIALRPDGGFLLAQTGGWGGNSFYGDASPAFQVLGMSSDGTTTTNWINDDTKVSSPSVAGTPGTTMDRLFEYGSGSALNFKGKFYELVVINRVISDAERLEFDDYFQSKYAAW